MKIAVTEPEENVLVKNILTPIPLLPVWKVQLKILFSGLAVGLFIGIMLTTESTLVLLLSLINIASYSYISYLYLKELMEIAYINISIKEYNQWLEKKLSENNQVKIKVNKAEKAGKLNKER